MNMDSKLVVTAGATLAGALVYHQMMKFGKAKKKSTTVPEFVTSGEFDSVVSVIAKSIDEISNDSLIKIVRQLEFWTKEKLPEDELLTLTEQLVHTSLWRKRFPTFQVPKVRFGKTELQMPIVTCGSMRFQHTWMPDVIPVIGASRTKAVKTPSQANILEIVRNCLKMGINHFETARYYGTSEVQLMDALAKLLESGEIKRSDFILQTKIPIKETRDGFDKDFAECWKIFEKLQYIDLLSFWCVASPSQVKYSLDESENSCMAAALEWKQQGKIKHIGFSTHGNAANIMQLINSNRFEYVNLHCHFFGSYHAEGTPDSVGGHGNLACVKRALELDMGVFNISPVDKGGRLYQPSATVARTVGPKLTPIAFAALHAWETAGMHTASVGFARPEDLDEILQAAELFARKQEMKELLKGAESRLLALAEKRLGKEWLQKGMKDIRDFYDESTQGVALGHILWCHNMLFAYDMYDTAKNRYEKLETTNKWNNKKSFEENSKKMSTGNPGRGYDESVDFKKALSKHYDPGTAQEKLVECHELLKTSSKHSLEERKSRGWDDAYDLRPWHDFPDTDRVSMSGVVLQNVTFGWFGCGGGPTEESRSYGQQLREALSKS